MNQKNLTINALILSVISLLVIGLWIPFGFKTTGTYEEWRVLERSLLHGPLYFITPESSNYTSYIIRPLSMSYWSLLYTIDPVNTFTLVNLSYIVIFIARAFLGYLIVKQLLFKQQVLAFAVGILFFIYPADIGWFTFRTMGSHLTLVFYLLATYLLLVFQKNKRWWLIPLMVISLAISLWMKETTYALVAFTPVLLVWVESRINREVIKLSILWYLTPLMTGLYAIYGVLTAPGNRLYQETQSLATFSDILEVQWFIIDRVFRRSWLQIEFDTAYILPVAILSAIIFMTCLYLVKTTSDKSLTTRRYLTLFMVGIGIILTGILIYSLFEGIQRSRLRTYYNSSLGAALCVVIILYLLSRRNRIIFSVLVTAFMSLVLFNGFSQFERYHSQALQQQRIYARIIEQVPSVEGKQTIIIHDYIGSMRKQTRLSAVIEPALRYFYQNPDLDVIICNPSASNLIEENTHSSNSCPVTEDMIVFDYSFENEMALRGDSTIIPATPHPAFQCWPIGNCTLPPWGPVPKAPLMLDFDGSQNIIGTGWTRPLLRDNVTFLWGLKAETSLVISVPDDTDYFIEFVIRNKGADDDGPDIFVNGTPVELEPVGRLRYRGTIPAQALTEKNEVITFVVDEMLVGSNGGERSFAIDSLTLTPVTNP